MTLYEKIRFLISTFDFLLSVIPMQNLRNRFLCKQTLLSSQVVISFTRKQVHFFSFRNKIGRTIFIMSKSRNSSRNSGRESSRSNRSHRSRSTSRTPSAASRSTSRSPSRANDELTRELDDAGKRLNSTFWQTFPIHNFKTNKAEITNNSTVPLSSYNQSKVRNILLKHFSFIWIQNLRNSWGWN